MKKNNYDVSTWRLWLATIASYSFYFYLIYEKYNNVNLDGTINSFGIGVMIGTIILIINDILKNKVYNRRFWVLSMLFLPPIALIAYMVQRSKLIKLGNGFSLKKDTSTKK